MDSESHENERGRERSISSWAARARRARPILGLVATGALALGGGCTTFDGLTATAPEPTGVSSSSSSGEGGAGGAGGTSSAGGAGGGGGTAGVGGAGGAGGAGNSKCADPALKAPLMVGVASSNGASYCIDTTEVTREQYATFLATTPELNQPPPCDGNMSYIPEAEWPPKPNQKSFPVIGVDFCDASAYCEWAGKRLCGAIGGGGTNLDGGEDPMTSQWLNACSSGGTLTYPYGDLYDGKTCNGLDFGAGGPIKVQSAMMCVGSVMGLFDMSGNVREWEDACDGSECRVRGGSFDSDSAADGELPCAGATTLDRFATDDFTGFRCCKD